MAEESSEIALKFQAISEDTTEQAESATRIRDEIINISDEVQCNTATAQETAASTLELSEQADSLNGMISKFKL